MHVMTELLTLNMQFRCYYIDQRSNRQHLICAFIQLLLLICYYLEFPIDEITCN